MELIQFLKPPNALSQNAAQRSKLKCVRDLIAPTSIIITNIIKDYRTNETT